MKKTISFLLILISISLVLVSCGKDKDISINYESLILGTWNVYSQDTVVIPASATDEFLLIPSFIKQDSSYATQDYISQITFSDATYSLIIGENDPSAENGYILNGDILTLYEESSDSILFKITYMNKNKTILDQDIMTMAETEYLFNIMKADFDSTQIILAQSYIDGLKNAEFEKAIIKRILIRVEE